MSSAYVVYDAGTFELINPGPFIPPLANLVPEPNVCDPHGDRRPTIPASSQQIHRFFQPSGVVENFFVSPRGRASSATNAKHR